MIRVFYEPGGHILPPFQGGGTIPTNVTLATSDGSDFSLDSVLPSSTILGRDEVLPNEVDIECSKVLDKSLKT